MQRHFTAAVTQEGQWYVARCLEIEVTSQGRSVDEALGNLKEALELFFEGMSEVPELPVPIIAPVEISI